MYTVWLRSAALSRANIPALPRNSLIKKSYASGGEGVLFAAPGGNVRGLRLAVTAHGGVLETPDFAARASDRTFSEWFRANGIHGPKASEGNTQTLENQIVTNLPEKYIVLGC